MDLAQLLIRDEWIEKALCSDPKNYDRAYTADIFTSYHLGERENALKMCARCDVREECLSFALKTNQDIGIWGGVEEEERKILRRQLRKKTRRVA